jgi:DNA-binding NarL/FixJ family response regulator
MRIRILLAELPRMLREIVEDVVSTQADMQIVGAADSLAALPAEVARTSPDVVILALERGAAPTRLDPLLYGQPSLSIVAITEDGRGAFRYELRPQMLPVGNVSPNGLLDAIRASVRAGTA